MSVSSETNKVIYNCDGSTTVFPYPFKIFEDSDLEVILYTIADGTETILTLTTDYTVSGAGDEAGGNVTTTSAYSSDYQLIIKRNIPYTQPVDYSENDPFPAETHEEALDRLTFLTQQLKGMINRALLQDESKTEPLDVPMLSAGKYLYTDGTSLSWSSVSTTDAQVFWVDAADYGSLSAAVAAIGSNNRVLLIRDEQTVSEDLTIPSNICLFFARPGKITVSAGVTLTINGAIKAGLYQIFDGDGTVKSTNCLIDRVYPQWFGAKTNDSTFDSSAAIQAAIDFFRDSQDRTRTVFFPIGIYYCNSLSITDTYKVALKGETTRSVELRYNGAGGSGTYILMSGQASFGEISNISFVGWDKTSSSNVCENLIKYTNYVDNQHKIKGCQFTQCYGDAIVFEKSIVNIHIEHCRWDGVGGYCLLWDCDSGAGMEARVVTVEEFTADNNLSGTFATICQTKGYYDGTHWGKGFAKMVNTNGVHFCFTGGRLEFNARMILDDTQRAMFYFDLDATTSLIYLNTVTGFARQEDAAVWIYDKKGNAVDVMIKNNGAYNVKAHFLDSNNHTVLEYNRDANIFGNIQQMQGQIINGHFVEFRASQPPSNVYNRYKIGDIVFNSGAEDTEPLGWIVTGPSGISSPANFNLTTTAQVTASSTTVTITTATDFRKFVEGMAITIVGAGSGGADLDTSIIAVDPDAGTITIADSPSTSVDPATIKIQATSFSKFGIIGSEIMDYQADSTASTVAELVTDFNNLLSKLKAAGLMRTS